MQLISKVFKISFIIACCVMFMFCSACASETSTTNNNSNNTGNKPYASKGVHERTIKARQDYLINNGTSDYVIVISTTCKDYEFQAAELLQEYLYKSTNVLLDIVYDDMIDINDNNKYISIGRTLLFRNSGISVPFSEYGDSGFRIVTKNNTIFVANADADFCFGAFCGAEELLYTLINFRVYAADEIKFDYLKSINMLDIDIKEIPEFARRLADFYTTNKNKYHMNLLRMQATAEGRVPLGTSHTELVILPPRDYYDDHNDWYGGDRQGITGGDDSSFSRKMQLCFSNEEMTAQFAKNVIKLFKDNPDCNFIHLGIADNEEYCDCDNCKQLMAENNTTISGLNIIFTNRVASAVTEAIQAEDPNRKLTFQIFAYNSTFNPPVHLENGVYVIDSEKVIPNENVIVQFAAARYNIAESFEENGNSKMIQALDNWYLVTDRISVWHYNTYFKWLMITPKDWDVIPDVLATYSSHGVESMYLQGAYGYYAQSWEQMKMYIEGKLLWDINLNYNDLAYEFIDNYYGDAAGKIKEIYDYMTSYCEYSQIENKYTGGMYTGVKDARFWPLSYVETMRRLIQEAYAEIEPIQLYDKECYQKYKDRIDHIYLENIFMQLDFYISEYSKEYVLDLIDKFSEICTKLNIRKFGEMGGLAPSDYIAKWRDTYAK